jgi:hypothetical protein
LGDAPAARSSFWAIDDLSKANELSADLEIRELRGDSRWIPAFHLALAAGNQAIALRLVRETGDHDVTVAILTTESGKLTGQRTIDGWKLRKGQRFQVTLDWSVPGTLAVANSATEVGRCPLAFPPTPCVLGALLAALGLSVLVRGSHVLLAVSLLSLSAWLVFRGVLDSTLRLTEKGVDFTTVRGRQHWSWEDITEAHLSGTGTVPGIAVYRGASCLTIGRAQFADLGSAARYVEARVRPGALRSSWPAG